MVKKNKELEKALTELKEHIKYMKQNDIPKEKKAKEDFKYIQKVLEDIEE